LVNTDPLLVGRRDSGRAVVAGRLRGGIADGDLTRARDGASRAQLRRVADAVLASWPRRDDGIGERGE